MNTVMAAVIDNNTIEEIRARIDIVDIVRERVDIKKAGSIFKGRCPFHNEKTPSFTVSPTRQSYKCYGCSAYGDVFRFVMEQDGLTFIEAVRRLADRAGVVIEERQDKFAGKRKRLLALHTALADFYQRCLLQTAVGAGARAYLAERKIEPHVIEQFSIGYAPAKPPDAIMRWAAKNGYTMEDMEAAGIALPPNEGKTQWYDRFQDRLMFPIRDERGRVVAFSGRIYGAGDKRKAKYVNSPETEIFTKGRVLYGLDRASSKIVKHPRREAIICEGQIDVIRCHAAGFETAVASQGTAFSEEHVKLIKRYADCAVLVFDGDDAGRKAAIRTGSLLLEAAVPVRVATLPPGEDPDTIIRERGHEGFKKVLDRAVSIIAFQMEAMRALEDSPESIDAVNRISHGVLETLAGCTSAVLCSSLLQEAAETLHLPFSALEDDLKSYREREEKRRSFSMKARAPKKPAAAQSRSTPPQTGDAPYDDDSPPLPEGPIGPPLDEDDIVVDYVLGPDVEPVSETKIAPLSQCEKLLCEMLVEHEHELPILNLVIEHLPFDLIEHPFARSFVRAVIAGNREDTDRLSELYKSVDAQFKPLFTELLNHRHKMLGAVEATPEEAMQDVIRGIWIRHYREEQGGLPADSTPDNDMKRLRLSCQIKALQTGLWKDVRRHLITAAEPLRAEESAPRAAIRPEESYAAASSVYEADSAYACSDPDEFQPSEYPPDEIPD
jgi:DNA primase